MRSFETVGRWGGEEFLAILDAADQFAALAVAERMRLAVASAAFEFAGVKVPLTISVGATAATPDHPAWAHILAHAAEDALCRAKLAGRNRVRFQAI